MTTATSIVADDFVSVPTRDLAAAMDFYGNVLGLPRSERVAAPGEEPVGAEFETRGTSRSVLSPPSGSGSPSRPNKVPLALHVEDVADARAEWSRGGIEFLADTLDSGVCHMAHFHDPDGNALMIHHRYAPRISERQSR